MRDKKCIDAIDVICKFSKGDLFLLNLIKKNMTANHEVIITKSKYTESEQQKITKAAKNFLSQGLIKRVRRECYLVNPFFLVPQKDKQASLITYWDSI